MQREREREREIEGIAKGGLEGERDGDKCVMQVEGAPGCVNAYKNANGEAKA